MSRWLLPAGRRPFSGRRFPAVSIASAVLLTMLSILTQPASAAADGSAQEGTDPAAAEAATGSPNAPDRPAAVHRETITVTATLSERPVDDTPGRVSVIEADQIEAALMHDVSDLVRFEPGVFVDGDPTRLGPSGFNVRGIGGNRVLTRIDGVPTAEEFAFGPLATTQYTLDLEALERVEIVRSAGSALYGSDALGGVVSLLTRDPGDYLALGDGESYLGLKLGWDGRSDEANQSAAVAWGGERWQTSLWVAHRAGEARDNRGTVDSQGADRTAPNPIDRGSINALGKVTFLPSSSSLWKLSVELFDSEADTEVLSGRTVQVFGPQFGPGITFTIDTADFDAVDDQQRGRVALEQTVERDGWFDTLTWRLHAQQDETEQRTVERRETIVGGGPFGPLSTTRVERTGLLRFEQDGFGGGLTAHKALGGSHLLTWGLTATRDRFDILRDRRDVDLDSGAVVPSELPHPTKYFPESVVTETGLFVQDEVDLFAGRLLLVPGVRYDRFDLDADQDDRIFFSGNPGQPAPVDLTESALSPRLGAVWQIRPAVSVFAQYARGFRAPSYLDVNNGFTNPAFGYKTLPNPDLEPETSDNYELGLRLSGRRGSFSVTGFDNRYDDFIETLTVGFDPTGVILFQPQNVASARIRGVELGGEARFGERWRLRGAYAWIEGEDEERGVPLNSIEPPRLALGLRYLAGSGRWGGEVAATVAAGKEESDVDTSVVDQYAPEGYEVLDLTGFYSLTRRLRLEVGLFNLTDETYWTWSDARGLSAESPVLDRYTSPGFNAAVSVRYRR